MAEAMEDSFLARFFLWELAPYLLPGSSCVGREDTVPALQVRPPGKARLPVNY